MNQQPGLQHDIHPDGLPTRLEALSGLVLEKLHHSTRVIAADAAPLYSPEEIGLKSTVPDSNGDWTVEVVGEMLADIKRVAADASTTHARTVILRGRNPQGQVRYSLLGLADREDGTTTAVRGLNEVIPIEGKGVELGRIANGTTPEGRQAVVHTADGQFVASAARLWGGGTEYAETTSRHHVNLHVAEDGSLVIRDQSMNSTLGQFAKAPVPSDDAESIITTERPEVALPADSTDTAVTPASQESRRTRYRNENEPFAYVSAGWDGPRHAAEEPAHNHEPEPDTVDAVLSEPVPTGVANEAAEAAAEDPGSDITPDTEVDETPPANETDQAREQALAELTEEARVDMRQAQAFLQETKAFLADTEQGRVVHTRQLSAIELEFEELQAKVNVIVREVSNESLHDHQDIVDQIHQLIRDARETVGRMQDADAAPLQRGSDVHTSLDSFKVHGTDARQKRLADMMQQAANTLVPFTQADTTLYEPLGDALSNLDKYTQQPAMLEELMSYALNPLRRALDGLVSNAQQRSANLQTADSTVGVVLADVDRVLTQVRSQSEQPAAAPIDQAVDDRMRAALGGNQ